MPKLSAIATMSGPKIAIIGAGPAGLTLALLLLKNGTTDITILEQETSRHARAQGGSLDLHRRTGQAALKEAGLFQQFQRRARYEGQERVLVDSDGKILVHLEGLSIGRPEIDRETLRDMLLDALPDGLIEWGHKIEAIDGDTRTLKLANGQVMGDFNLIVGADGAWSKVRPLLSSVVPFYSGVSGCELGISNVDERHKELSKMLGRGSYFAFGAGRCMLLQRQGNGDVRMLVGAHQPADWPELVGLDLQDAKAVKSQLLRDFSGFAPHLQELIEIANDTINFWPLYMLPVDLHWQHRKGVTLIGDAAHLMTPFAGEGVNMAMADALSLARIIAQSEGGGKYSLDDGVQIYEKEMYARIRPHTQDAWNALQERFITPDPAARIARRLRVVVLLLKIVGRWRK